MTIAPARPRVLSSPIRSARLRFGVLSLAGALLVALGWHRLGFNGSVDAYRLGARQWLDGGDLYGRLPGTASRFSYPPFAAIVGIPVALMGHSAAPWVLIVLGAAAGGVLLAWRPRDGRRGWLVGLAAAINPLGLVFVGYLLAAGDRRAAGRALAGFAICSWLAAITDPLTSIQYWSTLVGQAI